MESQATRIHGYGMWDRYILTGQTDGITGSVTKEEMVLMEWWSWVAKVSTRTLVHSRFQSKNGKDYGQIDKGKVCIDSSCGCWESCAMPPGLCFLICKMGVRRLLLQVCVRLTWANTRNLLAQCQALRDWWASGAVPAVVLGSLFP